jgi:hypothetical protein
MWLGTHAGSQPLVLVAGKVPGFFGGSWAKRWFPVGSHRFLGSFCWSWVVPQVPGWFLEASEPHVHVHWFLPWGGLSYTPPGGYGGSSWACLLGLPGPSQGPSSRVLLGAQILPKGAYYGPFLGSKQGPKQSPYSPPRSTPFGALIEPL